MIENKQRQAVIIIVALGLIVVSWWQVLAASADLQQENFEQNGAGR